ncbi:hypothetical protein HMN09_00739500 [Mycena chlorophos]|uniref:Uncharacterized protein n=1 Tax=Mycena chlorophos TaxID=658473 RepID=A0A8H6STI2_MYCCL|nr:hypothetical protein HMN09_00739500 [Mycena chlorophos]
MEVLSVDADALVRRRAEELQDASDDGSEGDDSNEEWEAEESEESEDERVERPHAYHVSRQGLDSTAATTKPLPSKRKRVDLYDDVLEDEDLQGYHQATLIPNDLLHSSSRLPDSGSVESGLESKKPDRQRKRRRAKRKTQREEHSTATGNDVKPFCVRRTSQASRKRVEIDLDSNATREPLASSGFVCLSDPTLNGRREKAAKAEAKRASSSNKQPEGALPKPVLLPTTGKFKKEELEAMGMVEDNWDGKSQAVYLDCQGREIVVLCGQPRDTAQSDWRRDVADVASALMEQATSKLSSLEGDADAALGGKKRRKTRKRKRNTRRGDHRAETVGVGVGGGRKQPKNFRHDDDDGAILEDLLASEPFTQIAGFSNSIFHYFAPLLHEYYQKTTDALFDWDARLRRIFPRGVSVFPSATFNFGPQTVTIPHLDLLNLAWGWCFITALGKFDPNRGGHLILWDLKRFIRFPPGATIAIPSALLRHSNVSIQQDETRYSFTQFAAGGLFQFVENGFRLNDSAVQIERMSKDEQNAFVEARTARFSEGLKIKNFASFTFPRLHQYMHFDQVIRPATMFNLLTFSESAACDGEGVETAWSDRRTSAVAIAHRSPTNLKGQREDNFVELLAGPLFDASNVAQSDARTGEPYNLPFINSLQVPRALAPELTLALVMAHAAGSETRPSLLLINGPEITSKNQSQLTTLFDHNFTLSNVRSSHLPFI